MTQSLPARTPGELVPLIDAATALDNAGRIDEAIEAYRKIVGGHAPQSAPSLARLVDLLEARGRTAEALDVLLELAEMWHEGGFIIKAHVTWLRAHWTAPDDLRPLLGLIRREHAGLTASGLRTRSILQTAHERMVAAGRHAEAAQLKSAARFGPEDVVEHALMMKLDKIATAAKDGRHDEAIALADAVGLRTHRLDVRARLRDIYETCRDWTRAAGTSRAIARALRAEGRTEDAAAEDRRADAIDPTRPAVWLKSARRLLRDGLAAEAIAALHRAVPLAPRETLAEIGELVALGEALNGTVGDRVRVSAGIAAIELRPRDRPHCWVPVGGGPGGSLLIPAGWEVKVRLGGLDEAPGTPADIASWPAEAVVDLDLSFTRIADADLAPVAGFTRLRRLSIDCVDMAWGLVPMESKVGLRIGQLFDDSRGRGVTSDGMAHVAGLVNLRVLDLATTGIDDAALPHLRRLAKLEVLMLNRTGVQGAGLKILADARVPLRELDLGRSRLSVGALELLEGFRALEVLHLDGMLVDGERLAALRHLPLHTLTVSTTAVVVADLRELKRLRRLDLSGTDLDDSGARDLATLDRLAVLGVRDTAFGDDGLLELTRRLPSLRRVYAGQNQFSEAAIARARAINPRLAVDRTGQALDLHLDDPEPTDRSPHGPVR